ncbi:MAG: Gfo/Idh/MocA family oxidoreductase [Woeseia sp.]
MSRVRMGMVGGGPGAFIGAIHRCAAALDGEIELVCGAFSRDIGRSRQTGEALGLSAERIYDDYVSMIETEAALPASDRMEFVAIVTPNKMHFPVADMALRNAFHVFCEKPATFDLDEALKLRKAVLDSGCRFGLAHTYIGYPMVQEARARVAAGELGEVTRVLVEYTQGWLSSAAVAGKEEPSWRLDPKQAGASSAMGDIGVHASNIAEFVTGLGIVSVLADLGAVVPGRELDDDGTVLLRFSNGARGVLVASQICTGEANNLSLRVYGTQGGLEWQQQEPNTVVLKFVDRPDQVIRTGDPFVGAGAQAFTRTPAGHPEGYIEAFANLYRAFASDVRQTGNRPAWRGQVHVPGIDEAVRGMAFIESVVASSRDQSVWRTMGEAV